MTNLALPKAILFDLDDTIISFDGVSDIAWEKSCKLFVEKEKTNFSAEEMLKTINETRKWYWGDPERHRIGRMNITQARREIVKKAMEELNFFDEAKMVEFADGYTKLQEEMIQLFPKSVETLEKLKDLGVRMALITNGLVEKQKGKVNRFCIGGYFEHCFIEEEMGFGKPDVRVYEHVLEKMNLRPDEVWMVGDNLVWDIDAPKKLGIYTVWNDYRHKGLPEGSDIVPDRIIKDISELISF